MPHYRILLFVLFFSLLQPSSVFAKKKKFEMTTQHFKITTSMRWKNFGKLIAKRAEKDLKMLEKQFGYQYPGRFEVRIASPGKGFNAIQPYHWIPHSNIAGLAYPHKKLMTLRLKGTEGEKGLIQTFQHELSHLLLFQATGKRRLPLWFIEGTAMFQSNDYTLFERYMKIVEARVGKTLPTLKKISKRFPSSPGRTEIAYALSYEMLQFLHTKNPNFFPPFLKSLRQGKSFQKSLETSLDMPMWKILFQWEEHLDKKFHWLPYLSSSTLFWSLIVGLFLLAFVRAKQVRKEQFDGMEEQERFEDLAFQEFQADMLEADFKSQGTPE